MGNRLSASQVLQLQLRETVRCYVRELAGWDAREARDAHMAAIELIERATHEPALAEDLLLAPEPEDLDALISGSPTKTP